MRRIDGIIGNNGSRLMELELIELALFFQHAPGSVERFADAIAERISHL